MFVFFKVLAFVARPVLVIVQLMPSQCLGPKTTSAPSIPIVLLEILNFVFIEPPALWVYFKSSGTWSRTNKCYFKVWNQTNYAINTAKITNIFSEKKKLSLFYEFFFKITVQNRTIFEINVQKPYIFFRKKTQQRTNRIFWAP